MQGSRARANGFQTRQWRGSAARVHTPPKGPRRQRPQGVTGGGRDFSGRRAVQRPQVASACTRQCRKRPPPGVSYCIMVASPASLPLGGGKLPVQPVQLDKHVCAPDAGR